MKKYSHLENLLSKYFTQFQNTADKGIDVGAFDQERALTQIRERIRNKSNVSFTKLLVAACVIIASGISLYLISAHSTTKIVTFNTRVGEVKTLILPDGSTVWLNAKSQINFPENLGAENKREITLEGEAYFEVVRNERKPFVINTQNVKTTVLGTTFNVSGYETDASVSVTVVSGKVAVQENGVEVLLLPNEQAVFDRKSKTLSKNEMINAGQNIVWKEGKLLFKSVTLEEVVADIQRQYNTKVEIGENIKGCKISADFTGLPIENIVKILGEIIDGSSYYKDNKFYLTGNGCI